MKFLILSILSSLFLLPLWSSANPSYNIELKSMNETFSFEMSGQKDWNYDLKRVSDQKSTKIILKIARIDTEKMNKFKIVENKFIKNIKVKNGTGQEMTEVEFELYNNQVQTFDYLTDYPSKLILDFYNNEDSSIEKKDNKKTKKVANEKLKQKDKSESISDKDLITEFKKSPQKNENAITGIQNKTRKPANTDYFYFDNEATEEKEKKIDLNEGFFSKSADQFERFSLKAHELKTKKDLVLIDYFVKYPILEQPLSFWKKMQSNFPEYSIEKTKTDESLKAKLIQQLYTKKRYLVIQQATDWFEKKFPKSKYLDAVYGMTADLHLKNWLENKDVKSFDIAQLYYSKLLSQTPDSILAERTSLLIAMMDFENKKYLLSIRKLNAHIQNPKYNSLNSAVYAKMATSLAFSRMGKSNEAIKSVDEIAQTDIPSLLKTEIKYLKADIFFKNEQYDKAIESYNEIAKEYPQYNSLFPNAIFNKMEAYFQSKKSISAHEQALEFIKLFPNHDYAPYAYTRVGEVLEAIGDSQQKAIGAYLETHFKFGDNPKTIVARLHLMGARMKGMKDLELKQSIEKMNDLASKSDLENIQQFKTMMMSDGLVKRKNYDEAINLLSQQMQQESNKKNNEQITTRIKNYIQEYIQDLSEKNKSVEVLKVYKKYADHWLRKHESSESFFHLGKAYHDMGVYDMALKNFEQSEKFNYSSKSPQNLYIYQALALFENKQYQEAEVKLNKITEPEVLTPKEQVDRVQLAAKIFEKKEDYPSAIRYLSELIRVWSKEPDLIVDPAIQTAVLLSKINQPEKSLNQLNTILETAINETNKIKILKTQIEISLNNKFNEQSINSLNQLLKLAPTTNSQARYQLGQLYFNQGDYKKAESVWTQLNEKDDPLWNRLAQEKMKSDQWQKEFKKYVDRLPASTGVK